MGGAVRRLKLHLLIPTAGRDVNDTTCFDVGELQKKKRSTIDVHQLISQSQLASPRIVRSLTRPHVLAACPSDPTKPATKYSPRYSQRPRYPHPHAMCLPPSSTTHHPTTALRHSLADPRMCFPSPFSRFCCFQSASISTKAKSRSGSDNGNGRFLLQFFRLFRLRLGTLYFCTC